MSILRKPLVTEKISGFNENNIYGFVVDPKVNKVEIKKEVSKLYGVKVEKVNTINYSGKKKVRYTKKRMTKGKTIAFKKAIVYLKKGEIIDFYGDV